MSSDPFGDNDDPFEDSENDEDPFDESSDPFGEESSNEGNTFDESSEDNSTDDSFGSDESSSDPFGESDSSVDSGSDDPFGGSSSDESSDSGDMFDESPGGQSDDPLGGGDSFSSEQESSSEQQSSGGILSKILGIIGIGSSDSSSSETVEENQGGEPFDEESSGEDPFGGGSDPFGEESKPVEDDTFSEGQSSSGAFSEGEPDKNEKQEEEDNYVDVEIPMSQDGSSSAFTETTIQHKVYENQKTVDPYDDRFINNVAPELSSDMKDMKSYLEGDTGQELVDFMIDSEIEKENVPAVYDTGESAFSYIIGIYDNYALLGGGNIIIRNIGKELGWGEEKTNKIIKLHSVACKEAGLSEHLILGDDGGGAFIPYEL